MQHARAPTVIRMKTGPAKFEEAQATVDQRAKVIFIGTVELPRPLGHLAGHQTIDPDNPITLRARLIQKQQVIRKRIETVMFQPRGVVDHGAYGLEFLDKDIITQALRREDLIGIAGKADSKLWLTRWADGKWRCTAPRHAAVSRVKVSETIGVDCMACLIVSRRILP
jgi:hypothetical protein